MKKWLIIFFALFSPLSSVCADRVEIPHFHQVLSHITEETLVILDIDDTLLIHKQMLGCDEWFLRRVKFYQDAGMSIVDSVEKSVIEYNMIHYLTEMEIVEPGIDSVVDRIQKMPCRVMGLTTRGFCVALCTGRQLRKNNIDLTKTAPSSQDYYFQMGNEGILYKNGVLFTAGTHKGEAFFHLCDAIDYLPKRIIFVNDKASHLAQVEEIAKSRNIPFIGLRYAYSDSRKATFNSEIANYQLRHSSLEHLITDEEAHSLLNKNQ